MNEASVLTLTVSLCLQSSVILFQYCDQHQGTGKHKGQHNNASLELEMSNTSFTFLIPNLIPDPSVLGDTEYRYVYSLVLSRWQNYDLDTVIPE